jgi:hypothetical protein
MDRKSQSRFVLKKRLKSLIFLILDKTAFFAPFGQN